MILGRFYLKRTINGNLLGEFSNYRMDRITTESADRVGNIDPNDAFIGEYDSTWFDTEEGAISTKLKIRIIANTRLYTLTWVNTDRAIKFLGEGFIVDGILIGDYRDLPMHNLINRQRLRLRQ